MQYSTYNASETTASFKDCLTVHVFWPWNTSPSASVTSGCCLLRIILSLLQVSQAAAAAYASARTVTGSLQLQQLTRHCSPVTERFCSAANAEVIGPT